MKKIQVLGTGCPKCNKLAAQAEEAARGLGIDYELEKITDLTEIIKFNVMMTPALVVDGQVKVSGRVPSMDDLKQMIS